MLLIKLVLPNGVSYSRKVSESEYVHYNVGALGWKFDTDYIVRNHLKSNKEKINYQYHHIKFII
jgi:hypothetical protein